MSKKKRKRKKQAAKKSRQSYASKANKAVKSVPKPAAKADVPVPAAEAAAELVPEPAVEAAAVSEPLSKVSAEAEAGKKKKLKCYDITPENDRKYRGPLSYRHFKMIAWLLIVLACLGSMLELHAAITENEEKYGTLVSVLKVGKDFSVPLLLFAGFATVLNGRNNYKKIIITNFAAALTLAGAFIFIFERYVIRGCAALWGSTEIARRNIDLIIDSESGFFAFNIFIDLTLCTLVLFFLNYNPKKFFQGKKIHFFRALVFLPIAYEIISICLKVLASTHSLTLPVYIFPFLTTKPPVAFLMFVLIAKYFSETEYKFRKHGKTREQYETYLTTNHNSFRFAKYVSVIIIIVAAIDFLLLIFISVLHLAAAGIASEASNETMMEAVQLVASWGFGGTADMVFIIPVILLFSYTRTHKNKLIDILIPIGGVVLIILISFDSIFTAVCEKLANVRHH